MLLFASSLGLALTICPGGRLWTSSFANAAAPSQAAPPEAKLRASKHSSHTTTAAAALRAGRYEEARRLAIANSRGRRAGDAAMIVVAARAEMALGQYPAAQERLEKAVDQAPRDLPLRQALCEVLALRGDRSGLRPYIDLTYQDWSARRVDLKNPDELLAVAAIVGLDGNWQDANETLRAAVRADPRSARPNVLWGQVFLEKHAVAEAETSFRAALAADPQEPDAHVGMASVHLRKRYDIAAAESALAIALRINSRHAGALALRAEMAIDGEDFVAAAALIAQIRRTNPHHAGAAWLAASRARLLDDEAGYRRERDARAAVHPTDAGFYASAADMLIRHRRTEDARAIAEEGTAVDPSDAHCQSVLGTTLLRLGEETSGVEALRRAWKGDPYNARTYNLLELYEKVVPRMETLRTEHLSFRIDPAARLAVERVVAPYLEETYARYAKKYGFQPSKPIIFELYTDPDHFAIRTVGMPGIGVEAVCFGRVITSQSPTNGAMNWGMVLAHELAHVFAIELSRSRVPRWFTEGLSELETMRARPEWTRHAERSLWGAARRGELAPLAALSTAFVRARNGEEATRAYAQSASALDYLDRRFGFPRIKDALIRFGTGARGLEVVATAMGTSVEALERGFRADLAARGAAFDKQYLPAELLRGEDGDRGEAGGLGVVDGRGAAAGAAHDQRADSAVRLGLAQLRRGDTDAATRALHRARAAPDGRPGGENHRAVLFLTGELALALRQADEARRAFAGMLDTGAAGSPQGGQNGGRGGSDGAREGRGAAGDPAGGERPGARDGDGYDVRVRLALAEIHRRDLKAAEDHLRRAIAFDPGSAEATGLLVELLGDPLWGGSREEDRLRAIGATLKLEPLHARLARELVLGLARRGRVAAVIEAAPLALFIEPGSPALHAALGRALAQTDRPAAAAAALEHALAFTPPAGEQPELRRLLDAAYVKLGRSRTAPRPPAPGQPVSP